MICIPEAWVVRIVVLAGCALFVVLVSALFIWLEIKYEDEDDPGT